MCLFQICKPWKYLSHKSHNDKDKKKDFLIVGMKNLTHAIDFK